jgi:energy-coupling factor transporter ATP-binding protein EcfA2
MPAQTSPATDALVNVFCSSQGPEIFRSIAFPQDVWSPDPLDVESIHVEARETFERLLNRAVASETTDTLIGRMLLLLGESGSGKTHLMRALRTRAHQRGDGYFGYMQMTSSADHYGHYVLHKLIDSLDKPYLPTPTNRESQSGLMRLSHAVTDLVDLPAEPLRDLRERQLDHRSRAQIVYALADRIVGNTATGRLDNDLVQAMLCLQASDPVLAGRVIKYLRGESLSDQDREQLGGITPMDRDFHALTLIERIGNLMWVAQRSALVICVDHLEDAWNVGLGKTETARRFLHALSVLQQVTANVPTSIVVIACLEDYYAELRNYLTRSLLDRMENDPAMITLHAGRTDEDVRLLASRHLSHLYDHFDQSADVRGATYPLPDALLRGGIAKRTRDFLLSCKRYRDACIHAGRLVAFDAQAGPGDPPSPQSPAPQSPNGPPNGDPKDDLVALDQAWNDYLVKNSIAPPDNDNALAEIVESAVEMIGDEITSGHRFSVDRDGGSLKIRLSPPGSDVAESTTCAKVCNKSAVGGGLGRQIENLLEMAEYQAGTDSTAAAIMINDYKPKTANAQIAKSFAKLVSGGGRKVLIQDSDWRTIQTLGKFRKSHASCEQFARWLLHAQPLSRLRSLRDLLGLDSLVSPEPEPAHPRTPADAGIAAQNAVPPAPAPASTHETENAPSGQVADPDAPLAPPLGQLKVGKTRNRKAEQVLIDRQLLKRHTAFLGGSGSGKTTAALNLIEQLLYQDIPVVLIDRKGDLVTYAREGIFKNEHRDPLLNLRRLQFRDWLDVAVYTPGQPDGRPISLSVVPNGISSMSAADLQMTANQAAQSLAQMLGYKETGRSAQKSAVLVTAIELMAALNYPRITLDDLIQYIDDKDDDLIAGVGRLDVNLFRGLIEDLQTLKINRRLLFPQDAEPLSAEELFGLRGGERGPKSRLRPKTRLSVISLKFLGDSANIQFWVAQLLLELLRWSGKSPSDELQAAVLFDEADLYLPATSKPATKPPMESLLKRARSAGLGVMLATQSPGDLDYKCRDNVNTWFLGQIKEERAIAKMKNMLDDCRRDVRSELAGQSVGEFFLVSDGEVVPVQSDRSLIETTQVSEGEIVDLARQTRKA